MINQRRPPRWRSQVTTTVKASTFAKIYSILTPSQRRGALAMLALMVAGMGMETLGVGLIVPVVALLVQSDRTDGYHWPQSVAGLTGEIPQQYLIPAAMLGLVAIFLLKGLFLAFLAWRQNKFAFDLQAELSQRLLSTYLYQPYTFLLQRNSAQLIRNVITEVGQFTGNAIRPAQVLVTEILVLTGVAALLLLIEPLGALVVVSVAGLSAIGFHRLTNRRTAQWGTDRQYHEGLRIQYLQEGFGGAKEVKLLGREGHVLERYQVHNVESARVAEYQLTVLQLPLLWLEVLAVTGLAVLVITMLAQGRDAMSIVPTLGLFTAAAFRLMPSVNRVLGSIHTLRFGLPVVDVLHAELSLPVPPSRGTRSRSALLSCQIELVGVRYTYPGAVAPALKNLTMNIGSGEIVGLIGQSGAGKSTLVDILLGLITPDAGHVRVNGQDIQRELRQWQDQIGYVPQSIYLTDDTLRRNVAFGLPNELIDDAAVKRAITAAQLTELVESIPSGLNTMVGEQGVRLSGGQRQRIGIARALYHDPAVLVLDEATSALDADTERDVMNAVAALQGTKTIIVVAHRLTTVEQCSRLYRLEHGNIVAHGSPSQVLGVRPSAGT